MGLLIYKAHMHMKAALYPEKCSFKSDAKAKQNCLITRIRQVDQYKDVDNPFDSLGGDEAMHEDTNHTRE